MEGGGSSTWINRLNCKRLQLISCLHSPTWSHAGLVQPSFPHWLRWCDGGIKVSGNAEGLGIVDFYFSRVQNRSVSFGPLGLATSSGEDAHSENLCDQFSIWKQLPCGGSYTFSSSLACKNYDVIRPPPERLLGVWWRFRKRMFLVYKVMKCSAVLLFRAVV